MSVGTSGASEHRMMNPAGMSFSPDGHMLAVSDTHNNRILIYSTSKMIATMPLKLELIIGGLWPWANRREPFDSADAYREKDFLNGRNTNYLVGRAYHGGQNKIRDGKNVPIDRFNLPEGLAWIGTDTLLVADTGNHRVKALKLNGEVRWILGQEGWKDGYFHHPLGIDVDCEGKVYVTEPRSNYLRGVGLDLLQRQRVQGNRMQVFSSELKTEKRLGHMHHMSGRDYRQFKDLVRVYVKSPSGDIFVSDNGNHRIMAFDKEFNKIAEIAKWKHYHLRYPVGIDFSLNGLMAIADTGNNKVLILDENFKILQILGGFGTKNGQFVKPMEARFGPNGNLFVLDSGNCRIQVFKGAQIRQFPRCPKPEPVMPPSPPDLEKLLPPASEEPAGKDSY